MLKNIIAAAAMVSVFASYAHAQTLGNQKTESNSLYNTSYDFEQKEYNKCVENIAGNTPREYINCLNPEIKRQTAAMNNFYTQILKLDERRGDGSLMVILRLVDSDKKETKEESK